MPRKSRGAYLYFDKKTQRYIIRDGQIKRRTKFGADQLKEAEIFKAAYIAGKHKKQSSHITCGAVINHYAEVKSPQKATNKQFNELISQCTRLADFYSNYEPNDIDGPLSRAYHKWSSTESMARRDLETFQAALNLYNREFGLDRVPSLILPPKSKPKDIFLTRKQAAKLVLTAHRRGLHHLVRFVLIGLYTGTRAEAISEMHWMPNTLGGHFDLEKGIMYRATNGHKATNKRREPCVIPNKLMPWLRLWEAQDSVCGSRIAYCIHYNGNRVKSVKKSFANCVKESKLPKKITPHILRHTAITWSMANGKQIASVSKFFNVTIKILESTYWHSHPDFQQEMRR